MTVRLPDGVHLSFHEAALVDYAAYVLDHRRPGIFRTSLTPWSDGIRVKTRHAVQDAVAHGADRAECGGAAQLQPDPQPERAERPRRRVLGRARQVRRHLVGDAHQRGDLGLRPEARRDDGRATKRYIDFAAANGFEGVLVEGWNVGWDGDWFYNGKQFRFTEPYPDFDLKAVTDYARAKGVRLVGHHETAADLGNYEPQMAAAFDLYESVGVRQVKTGYVADAGDIRRIDDNGVELHEWHDGQFTVEHHLRVLREAAQAQDQHQLARAGEGHGAASHLSELAVARGRARPGIQRLGQSRCNPPEHVAILPFTRMLAGPMDYTPGIVDLTFEGLDGKHRVPHTLAKELSLYVVLYSPVQMAADLPENYAAASAGTAVHQGRADRLGRERGSRRRGRRLRRDRAQAARPARLVPGRAHRRECAHAAGAARFPRARRALPSPRSIAMAPQADWKTRPDDLVVEHRTVASTDTLDLALARSGGVAIRFRPVIETGKGH